MKKNEMTIVGKSLIVSAIVIFTINASINIFKWNVINPSEFYGIISGFLLFSIAKRSLFHRKIFFRFGTNQKCQNAWQICIALDTG